MIEVRLELKFDSFLVNSMGKSEEMSSQKSARAIRLVCEKVLAARQIAGNKPDVEFDFLGVAAKREAKTETDQEFDGKLFNHLKAHTTISTSLVNIACGATGFHAAEKGVSSGEIGRMYLTNMPNQSGLGLELVFQQDEFDATWKLLAEQKVRKVFATLGCFKLMPGAFVEQRENLFVAGILTCSLQFAPND